MPNPIEKAGTQGMTTDTTDTGMDEPQTAQDRNWRQMEDRLKSYEAENADLRRQLKAYAVDKAGFEVAWGEDGSITGVGALLADTYTGDSYTPDALRAYAQQRGVMPIAGGVKPAAEPTVEETQAPEIEAAQNRMAAANALGRQLPAPDDVTELEERVRAANEGGGPVTEREIADALALHRKLDPRMG